MTLITIQQLTESLASALQKIETLAIERERKIADIDREYEARLRPHAASFTGRRAALRAAIETAPEFFKRPRTFTFAGIKVGYQKQKGKIVIPDEPATIGKMQKLLGDADAAPYLNVAISVNKTAVSSMPGDIMKKLGIEITADTDAIIIKLEQSALEKTIANLLADKSTEAKKMAAVQTA